MSRRRTTIEIDEQLLARAKEALRRATAEAGHEAARLQKAQSAYLDRLSSLVDLEILGSDEMWR